MVTRFLFTVFMLIWPYFGFSQRFEFADPIKLPGTINTPAEEGMPLLSPDGKKLFFSRAMYSGNNGGEYGGLDIWMSELGAKGWSKASNALPWMNNKNHNVITGISSDGKTLYHINVSPSNKMQGIYFTHQPPDRLSRPELIAIPGIDNLDFIGIYASPDLDVIFLSMKASDSQGNEDLYYTVKDDAGSWISPRNLGATINTTGYEISPFLSADKKRLYFASNGHAGQGDADIFYSERLYNSWETWSVPVNLGKKVNSKKFDAYFSLYGDSVAYFASNRDGKFADIHKVKVSLARTILAKGQRYLTAEEWSSVIGKNVSRKISFGNMDTSLTEPQQELIFYIVNKLMLEKDIRFHLVVNEEEDPRLSQTRLQAIYGQLRKSGIDEVRIYDEQVATAKRSEKGVIEIQLFK